MMRALLTATLTGCASMTASVSTDDLDDTAGTTEDSAHLLLPQDPASFRIVVEPADPYVGGLRVPPQAYGPYLTGSGFDLVLQHAPRIAGEVRALGLTPWGVASLPTEPVAVHAALSFRPEGGIPEVASTTVADGDFEVELVPGTYTVQIVPDDPRVPTAELGLLASVDAPAVLDLGLGAPVWGRVLDAARTPVVGAPVWAESRGGLRTASASTDDAGWFELRVAPGTWTVATTGVPGGRDPTLASEALAVSDDGARADLSYVDVPKADLELRVVDAQGDGVPEVRVRLSATALDGYLPGRASFELEARTDSRGDLTVRVPAGLYSLEVVPDADQAVGPLRLDDLGLLGSVRLDNVPLPPIGPVQVGVVDADGDGLAHSRVQCTETLASARTVGADTDADGRATLVLSSSPHRCTVQPPPDRQDLAAGRVTVGDPSSGFRAVLGEGVLVEGQARIALPGRTVPAAWAVVRVVDDAEATIGLGLTDEEGRFTVRFRAGVTQEP